MTRYCPKCGEPVPSNSLTCPKCYAKMPPEPVKVNDDGTGSRKKTYNNDNKTLYLILAIIPGLFGILGLGQIVRDYTQKRGYIFLLIGLLLFLTVTGLMLSPLHIVLKIITIFAPAIMYLFVFIISVLDIAAGISLSRFGF